MTSERNMEKSQSYSFHPDIVKLPLTVVAKVAAFVTWKTKINLILGIPEWEEFLCNKESWNLTCYEEKCPLDIFRERKAFINCLLKFGKYVSQLHVTFHVSEGILVQDILEAIFSSCINMRLFRSTNFDFRNSLLMDLFFQILGQCSKLKDLQIYHPKFDLCSDCDIIMFLNNASFSYLVTCLSLGISSFANANRHVTELNKFYNLRSLRFKRNYLSKETLLTLVHNQLEHLTLVQEESNNIEYEDGTGLLYNEAIWEAIKKTKPELTVNLVVKEMYLIRSVFPASTPLHSLIFVNITQSITKGLLEHIVTCYKGTLEVFIHASTNESHEISNQLEDPRLSGYMPQMVKNCFNLTTLIFGYEISAIEIVLIAEVRPLLNFIVVDNSVTMSSCNFGALCHEEWSQGYVDWIKDSCHSVESLQHTVSTLYGYEWRLASAEHLKHMVNLFSFV